MRGVVLEKAYRLGRMAAKYAVPPNEELTVVDVELRFPKWPLSVVESFYDGYTDQLNEEE
jgi:hypothetical protein